MKPYLLIGLPLTLASGFLAGSMSRPAQADSQVSSAFPVTGDPKKSHDTSDSGNPAPAARIRRDTPASSSHKPADNLVAVPLKEVVKILKADSMRRWSINSRDGRLEDALTLLGLQEREKTAVLDLFEKSRQQIASDELDHAKVTQPNVATVTVDFNDMGESSQRIADQLRASLPNLLPAELAQALDDSIVWDSFYFQNGKTGSIKIFTSDSGHLGASFSGMLVRDTMNGKAFKEYSDGARPVPLAALLGNDLEPLMKDLPPLSPLAGGKR